MISVTFPARRRDSVVPGSTVLIADGQILVREGMKILVGGVVPGADFVEAGDADALLAAAACSPALRFAMIDLHLPGLQGVLRLAEMANRWPRLPLIVLSSFTSLQLVSRITSIATVHAFIAKSSDVPTIHSAIEAVVQSRRGSTQPAMKPTTNAAGLTPRQQEICSLLRQGLSNKTIALRLGISAGTVKNHLSEIFRILNATNRHQVAQLDSSTQESAG